jgi:hypothetical protein
MSPRCMVASWAKPKIWRIMFKSTTRRGQLVDELAVVLNWIINKSISLFTVIGIRIMRSPMADRTQKG